MIDVVAALIKRDRKVLIAKRSTGDPNVYGKWEFPGGKVKKGKCEGYAIEREIKHDHYEYKWVCVNELLEYEIALADVNLIKCIK